MFKQDAFLYPELSCTYEGFTVDKELIGEGQYGRVFKCTRDSD